MDQVTDLIERLIYRVKQKETLEKKENADKDNGMVIASSNKNTGLSAEKMKPLKEPIKFQSGKNLPTIDSGAPESSKYDFPTLGAGLNGKETKQR